MTTRSTTSNAILLVEDNADDLELTRRALAENGIANRIVVARDGVEALDYLHGTGAWADRDPSEQPQIVLLDLKLPKIDGIEVLRAMRANDLTALVPVIVLTSSREENDIITSYGHGANSYVRKPVDFNEFRDAVGKLGMYWLLLNESPPRGGGRRA